MNGIDVHQYFTENAEAFVSPTSHQMKTSQILQIAGQVRALKAAGNEICNLTVGDFSPEYFPVPECVTTRASLAYSRGETNYPPPDGLMELRTAIADVYARRLGLNYGPESVCIGSGARPPIFATLSLLTEPGDVTVSCLPAWNMSYYAQIFQTRHTFITTTAENNFFPTVAQIEATLDRARVILLNTPLNPTGTMISPDVLRGIAAAIVAENKRRRSTNRRPVMLLFDQVYWLLTMKGHTHCHPVQLVPECAPYVINIDAASKSFAGTGLRVGWAVLPPVLQERMRAFMGHMGAWAPKPEQLGIASLMAQPKLMDAYLTDMQTRIQQRLDTLYNGIMDMKSRGVPVDAISPQGAIYLSFRVDMIGNGFSSNEEIRAHLLEEAGVAVVPFQAFDLHEDTGWLRMSVGAVGVAELSGALQRLEATLRKRR